MPRSYGFIYTAVVSGRNAQACESKLCLPFPFLYWGKGLCNKGKGRKG